MIFVISQTHHACGISAVAAGERRRRAPQAGLNKKEELLCGYYTRKRDVLHPVLSHFCKK
jgi:hypothetical protein